MYKVDIRNKLKLVNCSDLVCVGRQKILNEYCVLCSLKIGDKCAYSRFLMYKEYLISIKNKIRLPEVKDKT